MRRYLSLVTFSHTIFALPFAALGFTLAVVQPEYPFEWADLGLVLVCMVTARSAAMGFNRLVDAPIDARNPRTASRDIPAGRISRRRAAGFVAVNVAAFVAAAGLLNTLCLLLSPVALAVILGYSYTKRFTWLCHLVLGVGLGLAPLGAYLAVTGSFAPLPALFGVVVLLWVGGFDVVYALQDEGFDRGQGLRSIPTRFGAERALRVSRGLHLACVLALGLATYAMIAWLGATAWITVLAFGLFAAALAYQQSIVSAGDLSRVDRAFFTTNGVASLMYAALVVPGLAL